MSFLNAFKKLNLQRQPLFRLIGDCILVEILETKEIKTKGIIIPTEFKKSVDGVFVDRPLFARVLLIGEGFYDEENQPVPLEVEMGDIVLIGQHAVRRISYFGPLVSSGTTVLGMIRESEIQMRFFGENAYKTAMSLLEEEKKENVK